ncbi:MAG: T9SS type A sorting domain-containing protein [Saprospiraceae bacterium]|nr:T9SS type A sorting domain-containing protein [Saprospiraceae bacterium]
MTEMQDDDGSGSGKAVIQVTGGVPPYAIFWSNGIRGSMLENVRFGTYNVSVEDRLRCMSEMEITINSSNAVPSYFAYPNPVEGGRHINLEFRSPIRQIVRVIINDMQGRSWEFEQFQAEAGTSTGSILAPLVPGVYAVQLFYVTTGERYTYMQLVKSSLFRGNGN